MMSSTVTSQTTSVHKSAPILGGSTPATAGGTLPEAPSSSLSSVPATGTYHSAMTKPIVTGLSNSSSGSAPSTSGQQQQRQILPAPKSHSPPLLPATASSEIKTNMSGLLNTKNLDEKLVAATLATLNSGTASSLIKQDLKWIIQSRRKAEGKSELQVEFKKPVKEEQLTSEEVTKRSRRRELNRLAARRSREKGQKRKDMLVEEIRKLQTHNNELMGALSSLTEQRNQIIDTLRQHMKQCSDYEATQKASVGLSHRVLSMLGVHTPESEPLELALSVPPVSIATAQPSPAAVADVSGMSALYISTSDLGTSPTKLTMSPGSFKTDAESCHPSPHVLNLDKISGSPANLHEGNNEAASPFKDSSVVADLDINVPVEKFLHRTDYSVPESSKVDAMLQPQVPNSSAQVFLVSSSEIYPPVVLPSPSLPSAAVKTVATPSIIDLRSLVHIRTASEIDSSQKSWSSPLSSSSHRALNIQGPISKDGPPLVPILPKPSKVYQRRNSIASLSGSSEEGITGLIPHPALIGSSPSPMQSAPSDSGLGSSQEEGGDGIGEEVVHYKHKLMKHRKQHSTDFTHPSRPGSMSGEGRGPGGRPSLLERSFSFPSSRSETVRSSSEAFKTQAPAVFTAATFPCSSQSSSGSSGFPQHTSSSNINPGFTPQSLPTCVSSSIITDKFISEALPSKLPSSSFSSSEDHSALPIGSKKPSSIFKFHDASPRSCYVSDTAMDEDRLVDEGEIRGWASPMDTWPPAGSSRSSHQFPRQERRWSVDDYPATPLNLSRHGSQDDIGALVESGHRTVLSRSSSPVSLPGSDRKPFGFDNDPSSYSKR